MDIWDVVSECKELQASLRAANDTKWFRELLVDCCDPLNMLSSFSLSLSLSLSLLRLKVVKGLPRSLGLTEGTFGDGSTIALELCCLYSCCYGVFVLFYRLHVLFCIILLYAC